MTLTQVPGRNSCLNYDFELAILGWRTWKKSHDTYTSAWKTGYVMKAVTHGTYTSSRKERSLQDNHLIQGIEMKKAENSQKTLAPACGTGDTYTSIR